jgi:hypothetical protein
MAPPKFTLGPCVIPLTRGKYALVDAADYRRLLAHRWYFQGSGYAARRITRAVAPGVVRQWVVYMHREVLGLPEQPLRVWRRGDLVVDHINRDKLDNRRSNLRLVSHPTNMRNQDARGRSGFVGVRQTPNGRWIARVHVMYKQVHIGRFDTLEEAVEARRQYMEMLGE